jgi:two-component system, chemotaxis family, protein-glutamate methylesterase/glutaminase
MVNERIVVIGTSAGGLETLRTLVAALPGDFAAPICIVMHTAPEAPRVLHEILARSGRLPAVSVAKSERLTSRRIYVAPPDCHLVIEPGRVRATKGPRENRFRPAIDPLFRSAAQVYGPAAVGVILTGNLDDGTAGLATIKQLGGIAVVQDPADALFPSMPLSALQHVKVDHQSSLADLPDLLVRLTATPLADAGGFTVPDKVHVEVNIAKEQHPGDAGLEALGTPSPYACPECHGVLLQLEDHSRVRFRCHTGHAYSIESLVADVDEGIDTALWNAIRALEEATLLMRRLGSLLPATSADQATRIARRAEDVRRQSDAIRSIMVGREPLTSKT